MQDILITEKKRLMDRPQIIIQIDIINIYLLIVGQSPSFLMKANLLQLSNGSTSMPVH